MKPCAPAWPIWLREERERDELSNGNRGKCGKPARLRVRQAECRDASADGAAHGSLPGMPRICRRPASGVAVAGGVGTGGGFDGFRPPPVPADRATGVLVDAF